MWTVKRPTQQEPGIRNENLVYLHIFSWVWHKVTNRNYRQSALEKIKCQPLPSTKQPSKLPLSGNSSHAFRNLQMPRVRTENWQGLWRIFANVILPFSKTKQGDAGKVTVFGSDAIAVLARPSANHDKVTFSSLEVADASRYKQRTDGARLGPYRFPCRFKSRTKRLFK